MKTSNKKKRIIGVVAAVFLLHILTMPLAAGEKQEPAEPKKKAPQESVSIFDISFWTCPIEGTSSYRIYLNKILCVLDSPTQLAQKDK